MLEISKYMMDTLKNDATITGYTGKTVSDTRIYTWNPPIDIVFSSTYPAAIFYRERQDMRPSRFTYPAQKGDIYYYFQVVSTNKTLTKQIAERMITLFDELSITTTNWRVGIVKLNSSADGNIEGTATKPLYTQNISFYLKEVLRRDT